MIVSQRYGWGVGPRDPCCGTLGCLDVHDCFLFIERRGFLDDDVDALISAETALEWYPLQDLSASHARAL